MGQKKCTVPWSIDLEIDNDLPGVKKKKSGRGYDIDCPFCGKKRKFHVDPVKGLARCNYCDEGFNSITLRAKLRGITNKQAYRELKSIYRGIPVNKKEVYKPKEMSVEKVPAKSEMLNRVYTSLLQELTLSERHLNDLKKRGLSEEDIQRIGYKTMPVIGKRMLGKKIYFLNNLSQLPENVGIPGFYDLQEGGKMVIRKNSIMCPIRELNGKICGFQLRNNNLSKNASKEQKEGFVKYTSFSSSEKKTGCSTSGANNIHFAGDWSKIPETVNLTEGVIKADVAACLSKKPFMGLTGVNNVSQLAKWLKYLKSHGTSKVNICVDMDYREKKEVAKALNKIKEIILSAGMTYQLIEWPTQIDGYPEELKGIDDFLLAKKTLKGDFEV